MGVLIDICFFFFFWIRPRLGLVDPVERFYLEADTRDI